MNFPDVVRIEPVGVCNFHCTHCPIGVEGGHRRILSFDEFQFFFGRLPFVPRVLVLYHGGEPTLNGKLGNMLEYAKSSGVQKTILNTNASRLGMDFSDLDEMRVSFDGDSPEENDSIRLGSNFYRDAQNVIDLLDTDRRPRRVVIYNAGSGQPALYLKEFFKDCDVTFRGEPLRVWARKNNAPLPSNGTTHCVNLFETFTILSNGDVPMCCEDLQGDDIQGNARDSMPLEIWERMEERRSQFLRREYPRLCQSCWVTTR